MKKPSMNIVKIIGKRAAERRWAEEYSDYGIFPTGPIGDELYRPGTTVGAVVEKGHPAALEELLCCLEAEVIELRRSVPLPPL